MTLRIAELETVFTANLSDYDRGAAKVTSSQKAIDGAKPVVKVGAETKSALTDMDKVSVDAAKLDKTKIEPKVEVDTAKARAAMTDLGTTMAAAGAVVAAGIGLSVAKFSDFDKAMSQAQAGTMATGKALGALRAEAIKQGADTQYSASEAANAITEMGKAGVSTADILGGGLSGALALAASGQIAVGRAGEIAATAMNQFGLAGKDLPHVADLMAAAAGKAQGGVEDIANAMKYVGPVAKNLNVSIEQTTGVIAELAAQGIIGEMAGTSLRGMLLSLTSPSKIASKTMEDLGINVYNASGKFIGLDGVAGILQARLGTLDDATRNEALGRIFGNEQITTATILYKGGSKAVEDWTAKVNDSGFAARQAAMLTDNLSGDMERLGGSLDTALIQTGSGANDVLRSMAQHAEAVVNILGELDPKAIQVGLAVMTGVAAVGLLGGALLILAPKIMATKEALETLSQSHAKTANVVKGIGLAAGIATGALALGAIGLSIWSAHAADARAKTDALAQTLDKATGAVTALTRETVKDALAQKKSWAIFDLADSAYNNAKKLGISLDLITDAASGNKTAMSQVNDQINSFDNLNTDKVRDQLAKAGISVEELVQAQGQLRDSLKGSNSQLDDAQAIVKQKAEADAKAAKNADGFTTAVDFTTKAVDRQVLSLADLVQMQKDAAGIQITAAEAEAAWAQQVMDNTEALKGLKKATEDGGSQLDLYSESGQIASKALTDTANAAWAMLDAAQKSGTGTDELRQKTSDAREEFIKAALQIGLTQDAAAALADQYGLVPQKVQTKAELDKAQAEADLNALADKVKGLPGGVVSIQTVGFTQTYAYLTQTQDLMNKLNGTKVRIGMGAGSQGGITFANGGHVQAAANGLDRQSMIAPGGSNILWAEPETGWETYISGKPSQRARNVKLLRETASRFGLTVIQPETKRYADGSSSASAPRAAATGDTYIIDGLTYSEALPPGVAEWFSSIRRRTRQSVGVSA
jgi:TP901 family phage tail tape measure protein